MMAPRLLIFDFDGVLANTEELYWAAFAKVLAPRGIELTRDEYYQRCLGLPDAAAFAAVFAARGRILSEPEGAELVALRRRAYAEVAGEARLFPGVPSTLRSLHRSHLLAIASGAFRDEIALVLAHDGVGGLFAAVVAAEDVDRGKPFPDPFLRALESVNRDRGEALKPEDCLVVEDAPHGIEAARAAGMRCIAVASSHTPAELAAADAVITEVNQLGQMREWP